MARRRTMRKQTKYVIGGLVLAGLGVGAYYLYKNSKSNTAQLPASTTPTSTPTA